MSLARLASGMAALARHAADHRHRYLHWLPPQDAFLRDPSKRKLMRCGNQAYGKSTAGLTEVHWRCIGHHPHFAVQAPPIEAWIVCASWPQSIAIQRKFWDLIDRDALDPETRFDSLKGFIGKNPAVKYRNGSIVRFKTTQQGGLNLASATIHVVHIDEPTEPRIYGELQKRVARTNGTVLLTMTPINGPVDWLRELCEAGAIADHHFPLRAENLIPVGDTRPLTLEDGTPMDQAWCDHLRDETLPSEVGVLVDGEWEVRIDGRVFAAFDKTKHVRAARPTGKVKLCLGMDHGDGAHFSQVAILSAVDDSGFNPRIWVLDEATSDGTTTPDMDARAIFAMLERNGVSWTELDHVYGDRVHAGQRGGTSRKSNTDIAREMAKLMQVPARQLRPEIRTVKRGEGHGRGSVDHGLRFLHHAMVRDGHLVVDPKCERLIECIDRWDYRDEGYKHSIDAWRYGLDAYIFARPRTPMGPLRFG